MKSFKQLLIRATGIDAMKITMTELDDLALSEGLVWRQRIKKGKYGPPIQPQDFPNRPYSVPFIPDRYSDLWNDERVEVYGHMKLRRGKFFLCRS